MVMTIAHLVLALDSQTDHIDYTKKNFVHADMSPDEMARAIGKRGDDALTIALSVTADLMRQQNRRLQMLEKRPTGAAGAVDPLEWLLDPSGPLDLKRLLAEQLASSVGPHYSLGPTLEMILIEDRNKAALKVFQKELAKGKKRIAIFYGAGHMPDFERRLVSDFGLKRNGTRWLTAWDLRRSATDPWQQLFRLLER